MTLIARLGFQYRAFEYRVSGREGRESCAKNAKEYRKNSFQMECTVCYFEFKNLLNSIFSIANNDDLTLTWPKFSINSAFPNLFGCSFAFFASLSRPSRPEIRY